MSYDLFGPIPETKVIASDESTDYSILGRYAEFMVCAYLTKLGYRAIHVDSTGFDVLVEVQGISYRVQVKSTEFLVQRKRHSPKVSWNVATKISEGNKPRRARRPLTSTDCDILALFYRPTEDVVFVPVMEPVTAVAIPVSALSDWYARSSLSAALHAKGASYALTALPVVG